MPDLPAELRDRAAKAVFELIQRSAPNMDVPAELVVDAVAEVLAEHQTDECTCTGFPQPEGPCAWCDVHGRPSVAWSQGVENGVQQERVLSEMRIADLRVRAERAEADLARARAVVDAAEALVEHWRQHPNWHTGEHADEHRRLELSLIVSVRSSSVSPDHTEETGGE